ncbi:protein of unknown function (plasmid) [Azospirillum baldaniorum]|uniref:Uncharacterized protein n=1 Tax=Azospirillum baldaniorum TaxID=1064539 RepID=A0A9P1K044_9PROT|nr:protein of unknown function [Azospirillum baldaniorum]
MALSMGFRDAQGIGFCLLNVQSGVVEEAEAAAVTSAVMPIPTPG